MRIRLAKKICKRASSRWWIKLPYSEGKIKAAGQRLGRKIIIFKSWGDMTVSFTPQIEWTEHIMTSRTISVQRTRNESTNTNS